MFVFKDVRVEPYTIRQVQFDNITEIQNFLTQSNIYYIEINDSYVWADARKRFNASREEYDAFVEAGVWIYEMGDLSDSEASAPDSADAYSVDEEDGSEDPGSGSDGSGVVDSESVRESEGDYSVYDWSRSDS